MSTANRNITDKQTPYPAPESFYGPGKFYTVESVEHAEKLHSRSTRADFEVTLTTPGEWNGGFKKPKSTRTCIVCGEEFAPTGYKAVTCGPACSRERKRQTSDAWYQRSKKAVAS